jgi:hypothetical protein
MRGAAILGGVLALAACSAQAQQPQPIFAAYVAPVTPSTSGSNGGGSSASAPIPTVTEDTRPCLEAAVGLERATHDMRTPESSILDAMRARCHDDAWSPAVIACFASMASADDFATCSGQLADAPRTALFEEIVAGAGDLRAALAITTIQLSRLTVGAAVCDQFIATVAGVMACEAMPIDDRIELGTTTLQMWEAPAHGFPAAATARLNAVCGASMAKLQASAASAGCTL